MLEVMLHFELFENHLEVLQGTSRLETKSVCMPENVESLSRNMATCCEDSAESLVIEFPVPVGIRANCVNLVERGLGFFG